MRTFRDVLLLATGLAAGAGMLNAGVEWLCDLHWTALARPAGIAALALLLACWWTLPRREQSGR